MESPRTPGAGISGARNSLGSETADRVADAGPNGQRRRASAPRGRVLTVANLTERIRADTGRDPTDAELAALLATSVRHIRRARGKLECGQ